jgi:protein-S-isoprenylcysteine O-methyltransferase Ste14
MSEPIQSILWQWLYVGWVVLEIVVAVATRTTRSRGNVQDRGSQLILWIAIVGSVTAGEWLQHLVSADIFGRAHWLQWAGISLLIAGIAIRLTAILSLGKSFSANVAIRDSQKINRTGLYRLVRHPSYSGLMIVLLGIGVHSRNWASLAAVMIPTSLALAYRIHVEEKALEEAFGEDYDSYRRTTKRLIPGLF